MFLNSTFLRKCTRLAILTGHCTNIVRKMGGSTLINYILVGLPVTSGDRVSGHSWNNATNDAIRQRRTVAEASAAVEECG